MAKSFICQHCRKPLVTTPKQIPVGNSFHPECFNELYELQREKDRERKAKMISSGAETKRKKAEAKRKAAKALAQPRKTVEDVWAEKLAGRRFDGAVYVPQERLLVRGPRF